jgi:hypothetical protein
MVADVDAGLIADLQRTGAGMQPQESAAMDALHLHLVRQPGLDEEALAAHGLAAGMGRMDVEDEVARGR